MKYQRNLARDVLAILETLAGTAPQQPAQLEPCNLPHLGYERWVAAPRRNGIDPAYQALMAEALAGSEHNHKAAS
jgi:hypothetical protein